jgi:molybdopterin synthase sulfur carrier subunit
LIDWLRTRHAGYEAAFAEPRLVRAAVNQEFAGPEAAISEGDEVAFFPPITGG